MCVCVHVFPSVMYFMFFVLVGPQLISLSCCVSTFLCNIKYVFLRQSSLWAWRHTDDVQHRDLVAHVSKSGTLWGSFVERSRPWYSSHMEVGWGWCSDSFGSILSVAKTAFTFESNIAAKSLLDISLTVLLKGPLRGEKKLLYSQKPDLPTQRREQKGGKEINKLDKRRLTAAAIQHLVLFK